MPAAVDEEARRAAARSRPLRPTHAGQLQQQHRQHAGHEVEDQPAEQRDAEDRQQRDPGSRSTRRRAIGTGRVIGFHAAVAVKESQHEVALGQLNALAETLHRHIEPRALTVDRQLHAGRAEIELRRAFDDHIRRVEHFAGALRVDHELALLIDRDPLDRPAEPLAALRHQRCEPVDQRRVAAGRRGALRQIEREVARPAGRRSARRPDSGSWP